MEALGCVLNPGQCLDSAITSWLAWFPFGSYGVIFAAGMVVGAILKKPGVAAVAAAFLALKYAVKRKAKPDDPHEQVSGKDAAPPVTKPKKGWGRK